MFLFHPWFGWMTVVSAVVLVVLAYVNHRCTGGALAEANKQSLTATLANHQKLAQRRSHRVDGYARHPDEALGGSAAARAGVAVRG